MAVWPEHSALLRDVASAWGCGARRRLFIGDFRDQCTTAAHKHTILGHSTWIEETYRSAPGRRNYAAPKRRRWPSASVSAMQRYVCNWRRSGLEIDGFIWSLLDPELTSFIQSGWLCWSGSGRTAEEPTVGEGEARDALWAAERGAFGDRTPVIEVILGVRFTYEVVRP